jgi:hypothetical protein
MTAIADLTFSSGATQALDSAGNAAIAIDNARHLGFVLTSTGALVGASLILAAAARSTETHYNCYTSTGGQVLVTAALDQAIGLSEAQMQALRCFGSFNVNTSSAQTQTVNCKVYLKG